MRTLPFTLMLLLGLALYHPPASLAAGNPVLDALAQGTVVQLSGKEAVSEPFAFDVTIAAADKSLNLAMAVGQPIAVPIASGRVLTGMIERIEQVDGPGAQGLYRLHIVPAMQRLQYRTASRTFYGKNVADVAVQLLNEAGSAQIELRFAAGLPVEEMLVQYQESDFAFVSRLMESAGIHYHFESTPVGEKVVLSDGNAGFPVPALGKVTFAQTAALSIVSFSRGHAMYAGQVQAGDYNWKTPGTDLSATTQATAFGELIERMFPAGIDAKPEAQTIANVRLAARIAAAQSCAGESTYPQLQAGTRVSLTGHPRAEFNQEYVITAVEHQRTGKEYRNQFRCLPAQIVFRPQPVTPVPVAAGVVSGIVVGPPGETRHVDQFGRVKVRFPWRSPSHSNANDPGDAGFVRVAQIAAGAGAAALWLPDVGDEVLVAFEHGDPRRPVVIGSVYNGKDLPPVALPANKHVSLFRQQAPNGARTELLFEGATGNERVSIQGSAIALTSAGDMVQRAGRTLVVEAGTDVSVRTGQHLSLTSAGNTQMTAGGALQTSVGTDAQLAIGRNWQATVGNSAVLESSKDLSIRVGQHLQIQSARATRLTVGDDALIQVGKSLVTNVGTLFQFIAAQTGTIQTARGLAIRSGGDIDIAGDDISVRSSGNLTMKGSKIQQN